MGCGSSKGAPASAVVSAGGIPELTYFDGQGRAELTRLAFKFGGVEFVDTRLTFDEWPKVKGDANSAPAKAFGSMPVLTKDGIVLAQSMALAQDAYDMGLAAAKETTTPQQRALDFMLMGAHAELQSAMYACLFGDDDSKAKGVTDLNGKVTPILEAIERQYKSAESPFLYRAKAAGPSLADLAVYNFVESPFPGLKALNFDLSPFAKITATVEGVKAAESETVQWVRGVAVPIALTRGFYSALKESEAAATKWLERPSVPEYAKAVLKKEVKKGGAADLATRWGPKATREGAQPAASPSPAVSGKPELVYFSAPGRAELSRLAFAAGSVEYDCTRYSPEEWPAVKGDPNSLPATLFGQMPVLKHGDFTLAQSMAIAQYAADIGMNATKPPTVGQRGLDSMMLGVHDDLQKAMYACLFGSDEAKAKGKADLPGKVTPILQGVERFYTGKGPYLYSDEAGGPTLGDLVLLDVVTSPFPGLKALEFDLAPFSKVTKCVEACEKCSKGTLAAYVSSRGKKGDAPAADAPADALEVAPAADAAATPAEDGTPAEVAAPAAADAAPAAAEAAKPAEDAK